MYKLEIYAPESALEDIRAVLLEMDAGHMGNYKGCLSYYPVTGIWYDQCGHIRIDTHGDNKVMQGMLKKLGFTHCGTVYVEEDNDPRLAFEKVS